MFPPWAELRRGLGQHQAEPPQKSQARQLGTGLEAGRADNPSISAVLLKNKVSQSVVWGGEGACAELDTAWLGFHWPWVLVPLTSLAGPGRTPGGHLFRLRRDAGPQGPGSASPSEAAPPCLTGFACTSAPPPSQVQPCSLLSQQDRRGPRPRADHCSSAGMEASGPLPRAGSCSSAARGAGSPSAN